jgi:aldehyde:ferredoxin oxidoreductase
MSMFGYAGQMLRCDLTTGKLTMEPVSEETAKTWLGGVGFGAKYLYEEVKPGVAWDDPENRIIMATGPLGGSGAVGAGTFNVTTKGAITELAGASQANGFMGAYLKLAGLDGIILQGASENWVYLVVQDGKPRLEDAAFLVGMDTVEMEDAIREKLGAGEKEVSVYGIGPAGENKVRFSAIVGDRGHVVAHNGMGAVMGSKKIKAVVVYKGSQKVAVSDPAVLKQVNQSMFEFGKTFAGVYEWGTGGNFSNMHAIGALPVRNYTTNLYPEHEEMGGKYLRTHYELKSMPCYMCPMAHVKECRVTEGPYEGFVGEEPEYEQMAAWGPQIGNTELGSVVMLGSEVDKLGMDCNEASWIIGWAMECYEKGVFTKEDTDGLELTWGNVEVVKTLLNRIARREGKFGSLLAEGTMRASQAVGGEAADWAIYGGKGAAPRGHDHRGVTRWFELFDTCVSNTGSIESTFGGVQPQFVDMEGVADPFDHLEVAAFTARYNGIRQIDDCLGTCRIISPQPKELISSLNAVTGWEWELEDAFQAGKRIVHMLRQFNIEHGLKPEDEKPSVRYGSVPVDGPAEGKNIMEKWDEMQALYYEVMGWDPATGAPLPETLKAFGLEKVVKKP